MKLSFVATLLLFSAILANPAQAQDTEQADRHALSAGQTEAGTVTSLARYLSEPFQDDALKARALFSWVANHISYDTRAFFSGQPSSESPSDVLRHRMAVCSGYAALFHALAQEAGLESKIITGYSRGYGVDPLSDGDLAVNHAWNAVKIDGNWRLVDPTWGAGYIDSETQAFVKRFSPHFFFTNPQQLVYHHFPEDPQWQLLDEPVSEQEFRLKTHVRSPFFTHGLEFRNPGNGRIETTGRGKIELHVPQESIITARLVRNQNELQGNQVLVHHSRETGIVEFNPTVRGQYELQIYVKESGHDNNAYELAASYDIRNNSEAADPGFPETFSRFLNHRSTLIEPKSYLLSADSEYLFKIIVPGAESVSVVNGEEWTDLSSDASMSGETNYFSGRVNINGGQVRIAARFPDSNTYHVLLEYFGK